ncbi:MAG: LacI family DNA-binding transcriptional regulator [Vallitaleaceae bacterium]|nr:LacI family DNA-binding transcriptional regulator [Vallitaleaceae bacterium]
MARKMGYTPNAMAKGLSKSKSNNIGLILPDISNPYYGNLAKYISVYTENQYNYNTIFANSNDNLHTEEKIIENFISERVGGVIIAPITDKSKDHSYIKKLERYNICYSFVTAYYPDFKAPYIMSDLEDGSYQLVSYLLDLGHRNIYFLATSPEVVPTFTRIRGYEKAYAERNILVDSSMFLDCKVANFEQAYTTTQQLILSKTNIDAIITMNDIMALGALRACIEHKVNIPEELSVAGYDNVIFSTVSTIAITTVNQDLERISRGAVDMLFDMMKTGQEYEGAILIQPELIIRRSTARKQILK